MQAWDKRLLIIHDEWLEHDINNNLLRHNFKINFNNKWNHRRVKKQVSNNGEIWRGDSGFNG